MGLLGRTWRVIRANVNSLINQAEDPEKVLEQTVSEMQQHLIQMRQAVAQAIATQKRTERQLAQNQATTEQWRQRAQLALEQGNEHLAREALLRGQSAKTNAQTLQSQLEQQGGIIARLKGDMRVLEEQISGAKTKKDMFIARARSAAASQKIRNLNDTVNTSSSLNAFERMEEKVIDLEAQSEALNVLETDNVEKQFAALESENAPLESDRLEASPSATADLLSDQESEKLRSQIDQL